MSKLELKIIAHIENDFQTKFGIPRQSNAGGNLGARIVFEPDYRSPEAFRGLECFSHIWLIWQFSEIAPEKWSPTVRPPRLGGNRRMGVFATRSPFRPNPIGLSCVKLERIEFTECGPVLFVTGADLKNGTPIYDIKPYLAYTDSHPQAGSGFADEFRDYSLAVVLPEHLAALLPHEKLAALKEALSGDPRPSYHDDPGRVYGFVFAGCEVKFIVEMGVLTVTDIKKISEGNKENEGKNN